jgi:hypothetical protein
MNKYELLTSGKVLRDLTVDELLNLQKDKSLLAPELHAVTTEVVLRMTVGNVKVTPQTGHVETFDEWFERRNFQSFEGLHMQHGTLISEAMMELSRAMRDYISEVVKYDRA